MKKRIISALLTVLMVMSLFTGLSVSAYADDENPQVVEYTLKAGDYVLKLCQAQGINYFTCRDAIIKLNGLKSENDFRFLAVGRVIKLPATDAAALNIIASGSTGTGTGSTGTTTGTVSTAKGSDSVAYYLIPYTIQRGETVAGICNSLGISFTNYADQIMKLNNISSWNKVAAGKTLLLPSPKAPAVGTTCYQVVAHKIGSGETAYNMAASYGVDYGQNTKLLQALNNTSNLAKVKAGSTFYIPVATTITASSTGNTGSTGNSGNSGNSGSSDNNNNSGNNNSGNNNSGNNNSGNNSSTKKYSITPNINTAYGTMTFYVNNATVSSAAAGDTVTVDVNTTDGKAISSLVVKHADGSADVKLEGNTFIMPGCNVRVDAEIQSGYDIDIESNYPTITAAAVSGVSVSSASQGANVKIVSTDPGYMVDSATVYYSTWLGLKKFVTVNDAMCFIMPAANVTVKATLKAVPTYNFYRADCVNGSFDLQVNGFSASKAAKGAQVTIVWKAMDGYTLSGISVTEKKTGTSVSVLNNSFTMPGCDVEVKLTFGKTDNAIVINAVEGGILNAYDTNGNSITEAKTGDLITIKLKDGSSEAGYGNKFNLTVTRNADGNLVTTAPANGPAEEYTFTMPAGGVTVDGQFIGDNKEISVTFNGGSNGNTIIVNDARFTEDGKVKAAVGSKVILSTLARDGYAFNRFEVSVDGEYNVEQSELANAQGYILMPNGAVSVEAFFVADAIPLEAASIRGSGDVSYQVSTTGKDGEYKTACSSKVGDWVKIIVKPSNAGFVVPDNAILVTDKATGKSVKLIKIDNTSYIFQMPSQGVDVSVILVGDPHKLTLKTMNADNNSADLQGKSLWQISVEGDWPVVENDPNGGTTKADVKANDPIVLSLTEPGAANYVIDKVVLTTSGGVYAGGIEYIGNQYYFLMPDTDTTCTVYLKAKTTSDVSLTGCLIYDKSRGSANFEMGGTAIGSCKAGDTVMVRATAAEGFTYGPDDVIITRADGGTLTSGTDVNAGNFVPVYEDKGSGAVLTGWIFKMPQGGVNVEINFKQSEANAIELNVYDETGAVLTGNGYVSVQYGGNNFTDISGDFGKVPYGSAVTVSLTDLGKSLYDLTKVTVDGVTCENRVNFFGFYMPNTTAKITVVLTAKTPEPTSFKLYSSYDYNKGTVGFYVGGNPVDTATEVDTVSIVFTPTAGYMLDSYTIVRNTDNVTVKEETKLAEGSAKTVDVKIADVMDDFTVTATFVNRTYNAKLKIVDKNGTEITDENLVQFKGADGKYKAVKSGSVVEVVFDNNVNIGLTSTGNGYKITKYTITDASTSKVKTATESNCSDFNFKVAKEGVSEIEIRLEVK
ncbi:MAG: LysM peptidoglycan-binding domain-containing protein [Clostridiales bacterium]|nr:LysM peptidoglycan-binding domain-containing protein [Clostridiales bacterium]